MDNYTKSLQLEIAAKDVYKNLIHYLAQGSIKDFYALKHRIKNSDKLQEKLIRKQADRPEYELENITDVVGLRFVTLFRREMPDVVDMVLKAICHLDEVSPNPFEKGSIREAIIYNTNADFDPMMESIKKSFYDNDYDDVEIKPSEMYSSVHIVASLATKKGSNNLGIPIEIQIRTVFEDAWGEIDHRFGYVLREGKASESKLNNTEYVHGHLRTFKKFTDACAEYADMIYVESTQSPDAQSGKIITINTDTDALIKRLRELGAKDEHLDAYMASRALKLEAFELDEASSTEAKEKALIAAQALGSLAEKFYKAPSGSAEFYLRYYSKMNEALCYMLTKDRIHASKALDTYEGLMIMYSSFPLLHFRIAQSLSRLGNLKAAITEYEKAKSLIADFYDSKDTVWPDHLPEEDFLHMAGLLPKLYGYNLYDLWRLSAKTESNDYQIEILNRAITVTEEGVHSKYTDPTQTVAYYNNILYYHVVIIDLKLPKKVYKIHKDEIIKYLELITADTPLESQNDLLTLDTLAHAYFACEMKGEAIIAAQKAEALAIEENDEVSDSTRLEIIRDAKRILSQCL